MSNASLHQNLQQLCDAYRRGDLPLRDLAQQVRVHAEAFEALDFQRRKQLDGFALQLERQADYADEGCEYEARVAQILDSLTAVLLSISNDAA